MDHDEALAALPRAYAIALHMEAEGADADTIGTALGLNPDAVAALLDIGHRKLQSLLADG